MAIQAPLSWGRVLREPHRLVPIHDRNAPLPALQAGESALPFGNGRSYGDSCLNPGGALLQARPLDRFMAFDPATGVLRCEAGVLLSEILDLVVGQGWFLPVTPGTRFVTVGGAIANDVHGKNHHRAGCFGNHVRAFELLRSDGSRKICSPVENPDWFAATIGGLGLTGMVTWAELQLRPVANPLISSETWRFDCLDEFFDLSRATERDYEYTVAWIDCSGEGRRLGRGHFIAGNHAPADCPPVAWRPKVRKFPFTPPLSLVNKATLKVFNSLYYHRQQAKKVAATSHYEPFFYPLDGILEWNRMYGPKGFYQYQCVLPWGDGPAAVKELLSRIGGSGMGSFLAVLKVCGDVPSPGMLSFPLPGVSLALDFPNAGERLERLFQSLDAIVSAAGGRLYPAKDGRMPATLFQAGYPAWQEFSKYIDPRFSSGFWRRVSQRESP